MIIRRCNHLVPSFKYSNRVNDGHSSISFRVIIKPTDEDRFCLIGHSLVGTAALDFTNPFIIFRWQTSIIFDDPVTSETPVLGSLFPPDFSVLFVNHGVLGSLRKRSKSRSWLLDLFFDSNSSIRLKSYLQSPPPVFLPSSPYCLGPFVGSENQPWWEEWGIFGVEKWDPHTTWIFKRTLGRECFVFLNQNLTDFI